jgi:D-alanine-D-alanine ligase
MPLREIHRLDCFVHACGFMQERLRVTVLAYRDPDAGVDRVVPRVVRALEANGHAVSVLTLSCDVERMIDGIRSTEPDLVFNLLEQLGDQEIGSDIAAAGVLDLLQVPYTGGGPGEFYLTGDKSLTKKVLAFESINFPNFAVFPRGSGFETGGRLRMPLFVKPLRLDASIGIDSGAEALVRTTAQLLERVRYIHEHCDDDALVEEYIEGRELYVGVLGNEEAIAFPPIEIDFSRLPEGMPKVMDARAKFDVTSAEYAGTRAELAELGDDLRARVESIALAACRALRVRDYGRVDLRLDETGEIFVLEVNASCYLDEQGEFAMGARAAGLEYDELIQRIVSLALARFGGVRARSAGWEPIAACSH